MTNAIVRARADLAAGRNWKARDRLVGLLGRRQDDDVLDLLANIHHEMRDLPAAGALWFVTGRDDPTARAAIAAWRERYGNDQARWGSLPIPVRHGAPCDRVQSMEAAARREEAASAPHGDNERHEAWWEPIVFGGAAIGFVVSTAALMGIGTWTVIRWIWS